jgi:hypothetical protein
MDLRASLYFLYITSWTVPQPPIQWVLGALSLGVKLPEREAVHIHLMPRSRMRRAVPSLPQYAFMARCSVKALGQLYLIFYELYLCPFWTTTSSFVNWIRLSIWTARLALLWTCLFTWRTLFPATTRYNLTHSHRIISHSPAVCQTDYKLLKMEKFNRPSMGHYKLFCCFKIRTFFEMSSWGSQLRGCELHWTDSRSCSVGGLPC